MDTEGISNRNLWFIVTGRSSLQEPEQVSKELKKHKQRFLTGLTSYKHPSSSSAEKVRNSSRVKASHKDFILGLSKLLGLDEWQCYELFMSFLENDFKGSKQHLEHMMKTDMHSDGLIIKIMEYYFEERLYILRCVKYILSYWQDPNHVYREEFAQFVDSLQEGGQPLVQKAMSQFRECCCTDVPQELANSSPLMQRQMSRFALQFLKEQIVLLEIALLYYKEYEHLPNEVLVTAKLFQSQGFGTRQVNRHLFDAMAESLLPQIGYLQVMILIEAFDLEYLQNCVHNNNANEHHIVKDKENVKKLDALFSHWGDLHQHGPIMLAWSVLKYVAMGSEHEQETRKLGSKALQCSVFQFLFGVITSEAFKSNSPTGNACETLVYHLMSLTLTFFHEDTLGDNQLLISLAAKVLKQKGLCTDFWEANLNNGLGMFLNSTRSKFALQFCQLLELLKPLAGTEEGAEKVFAYLDCIPTYTERLSENKVGDIDCTEDETVWEIVKPKVLYKSVSSDAEKVVLPGGTLGKVFSTPEGFQFVRWFSKYSAWKVFVLEIDSFLQTLGFGAELDCHHQVTRVTSIVELVAEILNNDWSKASSLEEITSRVLLIVQRCTPSANPPQKLIAACLNCLAAMASNQPQKIWLGIQQTGFLPYSMSTFKTDGEDLEVSSLKIAQASFGHILGSRERPTGTYFVTIATLKLFLELLRGTSRSKACVEFVDSLDLVACVVFILKEIFTGFYKWRYQDIKNREEIGQRTLEIFHIVLGFKPSLSKPSLSLEQMDTDQDNKSLSVSMKEVLIEGLLYTDAGQSLLTILGTGVDTIDKIFSIQGGSMEGHAQALVQLIKLAFSVLTRTLALRVKKKDEVSPLEQALSTHVTKQFTDQTAVFSASLEQSHLVTVIASYIYHRQDNKLPTLSTMLLTRLCLVAPMSMYASFGQQSIPLRDAFVSRLSSLTEEVRLKVAILEFFTVAVETQPGLTELFLDLQTDKSSTEPKTFSLGQRSCIHGVLEIIDPANQELHNFPSQLISSALCFLHALWQDRQVAALTAIRVSAEFWGNLTAPLFIDVTTSDVQECSYQLQTASYVLQIIALEIYHVSKGHLDQSLIRVLKDFSQKKRYQYWSKCTRSACSTPVRSSQPGEAAEKREQSQLSLLKAWRSFLVVASTSQTESVSLHDDVIRSLILRDTLEALKVQVFSPVTISSISCASELASLYLMLLQHWRRCIKTEINSVFSSLVKILHEAANADENLLEHIRTQLFAAISILLQYLRTNKQSAGVDTGVAAAVLPVVCEPLQYFHSNTKKKQASTQQVSCMAVFLIEEIVNILPDPDHWLPVLREHALFPSLIQAMNMCLKRKVHVEFVEAMLHLFLSLSRIRQGAESVAVNGLSECLCLSLMKVQTNITSENNQNQSQTSHQHEHKKSDTLTPRQTDWNQVWQLSLAVMTSMLQTLRHGFIKEALDFVGVHRERLANSLDSIRINQSISALCEAEQVATFLFQLAHFRHEWRFALPDVFQQLQESAASATQTCVFLLLRPKLLSHLVEHSCLKTSDNNPLSASMSLSLKSSFTSGSFMSKTIREDLNDEPSPLVVKTQRKLLDVLSNCLCMLKQFTPDVCECLLDEGLDIDEFTPIFSLAFNAPGSDQDGPPSFGTLIACCNMCLNNLSSYDPPRLSPIRSPAKGPAKNLPRHLLLFTIENSLLLIMSQAIRYLRDPYVPQRAKQLLKREMGSELGNFLTGLFRQFSRRGSSQSPGGGSSASPDGKKTPTKFTLNFTECSEQKFFRIVDMFVKTMLR